MVHSMRSTSGLVMIAIAALISCVGRGEEPPVEARRPAASTQIKVALYAGDGTGRTVEHVERALTSDSRIAVRRLLPDDIRAGRLSEFDVLVQPGGSGSGQAKALGDEGRQKIREFVNQGGGYIGVCAGSYLATCDYEWSLGILDAKVVDRKHWARGFGPVDVGFTDAGRSRFGLEKQDLTIYYHQGPLLAPADNPEIDDFKPLATFAGDIAKNGASPGVMPGTTAIAAGRFGRGEVVCFSPHPEKTAGQERLLIEAVLSAAQSAR